MIVCHQDVLISSFYLKTEVNFKLSDLTFLSCMHHRFKVGPDSDDASLRKSTHHFTISTLKVRRIIVVVLQILLHNIVYNFAQKCKRLKNES